jgi:hypothetical protein
MTWGLFQFIFDAFVQPRREKLHLDDPTAGQKLSTDIGNHVLCEFNEVARYWMLIHNFVQHQNSQ